MLENFEKGFIEDYGIKMNPKTLRKFCELEWPAFGVGWPLEGSLDEGLVRAVWNSSYNRHWTPRSVPLQLVRNCSNLATLGPVL